jgi:AcrR family transcriptional regulator
LTKVDSTQVWIDEGYRLFAYEGPDGIQIEKIARKLGRNKSGLYYHFGDRNLFLQELIHHHYQINEQFRFEIALLKHFNPGFLELLVKYKIAYLFQMQLRRNMNIPLFKEVFYKIKKANERVIVPLFAAHLKLPSNDHLVVGLFDLLRDVVFIRVPGENLQVDLLKEVVGEFTLIIDKLREKE